MNIHEIEKKFDTVSCYLFFGLAYFLPISIALVETFSGMIIGCYFFKRFTILWHQSRYPDSTKTEQSRIQKWIQTFKPLNSPINQALGFFLLFNLISIIFSFFPLMSAKAFFTKVFQGVIVCVALFDSMHTKKRLKIFLSVFLVSFALISINGLFQYFQGKGFIFGHEIDSGRINSSLRHSNDFGTYLVTGLPIILSLIFAGFDKNILFKHKKLLTGALLLLASLGLICLGLTYSRGAWFAFFLAFIVWGCTDRKNFFVFFLVVIFFIVVFGKKLIDVRHLSLVFTSSGRYGFWREALTIIRDYPTFGAGLNTYSEIASAYKVSWGGYPHNSYLKMAAEIGIAGISMLFWMIFSVYQSSFKALKTLQDPFFKHVLKGLLIGLFAYLVNSIFDTQFASAQLFTLLWLMVGAIMAAQKIGVTADETLKTTA